MDYLLYKRNAFIFFLLVFKLKAKYYKITTLAFASSFKNVVLPLLAQLVAYQALRIIIQYKKFSLINSLFFLKSSQKSCVSIIYF